MKHNRYCIENYPWHIILIANIVSISIYASGAIILSAVGLIPVVLYLVFILFLEFRLVKVSCTKCYYYDRYCAFGKGKLSALFFKKEEPSSFQQKNFSWYSLLPDMMVSIIPLVFGIYILLSGFSWIILLLMLVLILLSSFGNGWIRGSMACKYCKQKELGCQAEQLFNKNRK